MTSKIAKFDILRMLNAYKPPRPKNALWWFRQCNPVRKDVLKKRKKSSTQIFKELSLENKQIYQIQSQIDLLRYRTDHKLWLAKCAAALSSDEDIKEIEMKLFRDSTTPEESKELIDQDRLLEYAENYKNKLELESSEVIYKEYTSVMDKINKSGSDPKLIKRLISRMLIPPENLKQYLERPKRPITPFMLYFKDRMKEMSESYEKKPTTRELAVEWSHLDSEIKSSYIERYKKSLEIYLELMKDYKEVQSQDPRQSTKINLAKNETRIFHKNLRKQLHELHVPKKARSALNFYIIEKTKDHNMTLMEATDQWRTLPQEKRVKYQEMQEEDKIRYDKEAVIWKQMFQGRNVRRLLDKTNIPAEDDREQSKSEDID